ncbi:hypothetical protein BH24ACT13_BH24ACT13_14100 [soil metagenome]
MLTATTLAVPRLLDVLEPARLIAEHEGFCQTLPYAAQAKYLRRRGAADLLAAHPDLSAWMGEPVADRLAVARRLGAWPFLSWCFATNRLTPDLDLLAAKGKGGHFTLWLLLNPGDGARARSAAEPFRWCPEWITRVTGNALPLACLTRARSLDELTADDLDAVEAVIDQSPVLTRIGRVHLLAQHHGLRALCYQLGLISAPPEHPNTRHRTPAERAAGIPQPEIRRAVARYLATVATTVRASTLTGRAASLDVFACWLASTHPDVQTLRQLTRAHMEAFLAFDSARSWRGKLARDTPISVRHHARTVVDLRGFFDDITAWGWVEAPLVLLLHRSDIPRLPRPLPRALAPDVDTALMTAVAGLDDVAARAAITVLRGTGLRLGELLDLELSCLWELPGHGTWLKVPLGKLNTERVVPIDDTTLAALDAWIAIRGRQRALPHPRTGRATDFLFTIRGARIGDARIRRGLDTAAAAAGLLASTGETLRITPHQLRHTYATSLVNAGMSLQALMALLGHVTPEMTIRYASGQRDRPRRLRHRDDQDPHPRAAPARRHRPTSRPRPGPMAPHRDAQDPRRARLLLPPPRRPGLPLRQHLRAV